MHPYCHITIKTRDGKTHERLPMGSWETWDTKTPINKVLSTHERYRHFTNGDAFEFIRVERVMKEHVPAALKLKNALMRR